MMDWLRALESFKITFTGGYAIAVVMTLVLATGFGWWCIAIEIKSLVGRFFK